VNNWLDTDRTRTIWKNRSKSGAVDCGEYCEAADTGAKVLNRDATARTSDWEGTMSQKYSQTITVGRWMLMVLFWIWGGLGLILNILMVPSDGTLLLWIGGLLFFGLGGLLFPPCP
jgi:hypothetical protein